MPLKKEKNKTTDWQVKGFRVLAYRGLYLHQLLYYASKWVGIHFRNSSGSDRIVTLNVL
jgi:hypothetical protein